MIGLNKIFYRTQNKSIYLLKRYNKLQLASKFTNNKMKKFQNWLQLQLDHSSISDYQKIFTIHNLLMNKNSNNIFKSNSHFEYFF